MKGSSSRRFRQWMFATLLLILFIAGFIYMYRPRQLHSTFTPIVSQASTQAHACGSNRNAIKMTFLGSRPFCIHLLTDDIVSNTISTHRSWMPQQTKFISLLLKNSPTKPAVFLDIGANIGWFTLVMSVLGHKVIAIEPMTNNVELMRASLQASQASHNVIVHANGLDVTPGRCLLYSDNRNIGDGHTVCGISSTKDMKALVPVGYSERQVIDSVRLDTLVSQDIDVLKIDVEGSELHAMRSGARLLEKYTVRHIVTEFSPTMMRDKKSDPYEYLKFFVSHGYVIRILTDSVSDLYERNAWQTVPTYRSEEDLRRLSNQAGILDLWLSKN